MAKQHYIVHFEIDTSIELDDEVIATADARGAEYHLMTAEQIVEHIAYNYLVNHVELKQLDGWADLPNSAVKFEIDDCEIEVDEL